MMRDNARWLLVVLMGLGFMAAACSTNNVVLSPEVAAVCQDNEYRLGTGDNLRITVFTEEELSREVEVDSAGRITLPLVGDLLVVGRTLNEVEQMIFDVLTPDYFKNPVVSIEVTEHRAFYIIGEVADPGPFPYSGGMRVINGYGARGPLLTRNGHNLISRSSII